MVVSTLKYGQLETTSLPSLTLPSHHSLSNTSSLAISRRARSKDSGVKIIRKVSKETPCIQVVDGWAYAAVPRILNRPANGILTSSSISEFPSTTNAISGDVESIGYRRRSKINKWRYRLQHEQHFSSSSIIPISKTNIPPSNSYTSASAQMYTSSRHIHRIRPRTDSRPPLRRPQSINIRVDVETSITSSPPKLEKDAMTGLEVVPSISESHTGRSGRPLPSIPVITLNDNVPRSSSKRICKGTMNTTTFIVQNPDEQETTSSLSPSPYLIRTVSHQVLPTPTPTHSEKLKKIQIVRKRLGEDVPASLVFPDLSVHSFHSNINSNSSATLERKIHNMEGTPKRRSRSLNGNCSGGGVKNDRRRRRYGRLDLDFDFGEISLMTLDDTHATVQLTNHDSDEHNLNPNGEFGNGLSTIPTRSSSSYSSSSSSGKYSSDPLTNSSIISSEYDEEISMTRRGRGRSWTQSESQRTNRTYTHAHAHIPRHIQTPAEPEMNRKPVHRDIESEYNVAEGSQGGCGGKTIRIRERKATGLDLLAVQSSSKLIVRRVLSRIHLLSHPGHMHRHGNDSESKFY